MLAVPGTSVRVSAIRVSGLRVFRVTEGNFFASKGLSSQTLGRERGRGSGNSGQKNGRETAPIGLLLCRKRQAFIG